MSIITEEWRPVVGLEGQYEVSNHGRVRLLPGLFNHGVSGKQLFREGRLLTQSKSKAGYRFVRFRGGKSQLVHTLVLEAFVGPRPVGDQKYEACHWNGIKHDNRLENLRWGTMSDNHADRVRHGASNRGERSPRAVLTESQAIEILQSHEHTVAIAKRYGVSVAAVHALRAGTNWPHLSQYRRDFYSRDVLCGERHPRAKLTYEKANEIRKASGTISQISRAFGVDRKTVRSIREGKSWVLSQEAVA